MTQVQMILADLQAGKRITALDALHNYGCFRLAARIADIKRMGFNVKCEAISTATEKHVACYYLAPPPHTPGEQTQLFTTGRV